jgi:hypothetical protein
MSREPAFRVPPGAGSCPLGYAPLRHGYVCVMAAEKEREESDQLPEDAPPEQAPEDDAGKARAEAEESSGVPDEQGQATGNPANAG